MRHGRRHPLCALQAANLLIGRVGLAPKYYHFGSKSTILTPLVYLLSTRKNNLQRIMAAQPKLPCKFFLQNSCTRGESCQYSHHRGPPSTGSWRPTAVPSTGSWRTTTAPLSAESRRSATTPLSFCANVPSPISTVPAPRVYGRGQQPPKPTMVQGGGEGLSFPCKFFQKGFCSRGTTCKFAHVLVEGSQPLSIGRDMPTKETVIAVDNVSIKLLPS